MTRKDFECSDCEKKLPGGAYAKNYVFKKDDKYITKKICEDCEKYYRRKDLNHEEGNANNIG
jgi:hypothetical protein